MKLIIVEGILGSGKSSTARFISLQLERNNLPAELFHESAFPHPILLEEEIEHSDQWQAAYLSNWNRFLQKNSHKESVIVMEAVLFQSPILHLLHLDIDRTEILHFIEQLFAILSRFDCRLVYLYQEDPQTGINRMMTARGGEAWLEQTYKKFEHYPYYQNREPLGKELHLKLLHDYVQIARQAFAKCSLPAAAVDNTNWDWNQDYRTIMDFLGHAIYPDPNLSIEELTAFAGTFRNDERGLTIETKLRDDGLYIFEHYRLKPRDKNKFYLDNVSISLEFLFQGDSSPGEVLLYEKDLVGNRDDEGLRFVRMVTS